MAVLIHSRFSCAPTRPGPYVVTVRKTKTRRVTRTVTAATTTRATPALHKLQSEQAVSPKVAVLEENAVLGQERNLCPVCPTGAQVSAVGKTNGAMSYCCPKRETKTVTKIVRTVTSIIRKTVTVSCCFDHGPAM